MSKDAVNSAGLPPWDEGIVEGGVGPEAFSIAETAADTPITPGGRLSQLQALLRRIASPRVRGELAWIVVYHGVGFPLSFLLLKVMTSWLSEAAFGQYSLALSAGVLLTSVLVMPAVQGYLRYLHRAEAEGVGRAAGLTVLRWHLVATTAVVATAAVVSLPLSHWFQIEPWLIFAGGLFFFAGRWRSLWIEIMEVLRERKSIALANIGFLGTQLLLIGAVACFWPTATACLLVSSAAALIFACPLMPGLVRRILRQEKTEGSEMNHMIVTFGVPYSALLICQWVQMFADRYVIADVMDMNSVGIYVAAYMVCGIPYTMLMACLNTLMLPIVYQRCKDATDPAQVWSADKVLLGGLFIYLSVGGGLLLVYLFWGQGLIALLTNKRFVVPAATVLVLALGRYVQTLALFLQMFFASHQKMRASLFFRIAGALLTVPLCWMFARWMGLLGAALGVLLSAAFYIVLLTLGPGGCFWMVKNNYQRLRLPRTS